MRLLRTFFIIAFVYLAGFGNRALGQQNQAVQSIQKAFKEHRIDRQSKVLYQLYAAFEPARLPGEYRTPKDKPLKCATPFLMEFHQHENEFSATTVQEDAALTGRPVQQAQQRYQSASGRFTIFYTTTGSDAVPTADNNANAVPDYVEEAAATADSSWRYEVQTLGFTNPIKGSTDPYPIYIEDLGADNLYGYTSTGQSRGYSNSTYIVINSQLDQPAYTKNDDPNPVEGAIKVTIAHELKHAIQYANSQWYALPNDGESPHSFDWSEMDAVLMEEIVYDNVNDYYNYITDDESIFLNDDHTVPSAYSGVTWMLYFAEHYGINFWVQTWQRIRERYEQASSSNDYLSMVEAISITLGQDFDDSFANAFAQSQLWHLAAGSANSAPDFGFDERDNYPGPRINFNLAGRDSIGGSQTVPPLSAKYININTAQTIPGNVIFTIYQANIFTRLGVLAYFNDGSTDYKLFRAGDEGEFTVSTGWKWNNLRKVEAVISNSNASAPTHFALEVDSNIPKDITLKPNFPNPFSRKTTIPVGLPEDARLTINIYDVTGRRIRTLIDENRAAGDNSTTFDAIGLASGIYFYQVIIDGQAFVKKMTLIK